jgi:hypothetical protein
VVLFPYTSIYTVLSLKNKRASRVPAGQLGQRTRLSAIMRLLEWGVGARIVARPYLRKPRLKRLKNGLLLGALIAATFVGPMG